MSKDIIKMKGIVKEIFPNAVFKVELCDDDGITLGKEVRTIISGKLRMNNIKILRGDKVDVELSVYDLNNGRISWRYK